MANLFRNMGDRHVKVFIFFTLFIPCGSASQSIGLVYKTKNFLVSQDKEEFPLQLRFKVFSDLDYQVNLLNNIKTALHTIEEIPGVKNQQDVKISAVRQIMQSVVTADAIILKLNTIFKYRGSDIKTPTEECFTEVAHNLDLLIFAAENFISSSIKALKPFTVSEITVGSTGLSEVLNVLQDAYLHLRSVEDKTADYLSKLESLTSGTLSPDIYAMVQMSPCVASGELDKITLKSCEKTTAGILCSIEVETYLSNKNYEIYGPVNYAGVQIILPENKYLAKSPENTYGLLTCRDEAIEMVNDCIFSDWDPAEYIFGPDHQKAIENSNFTLSDPPLPYQMYDSSIMIMDKRVSIKIRVGQGTEKDISNTSPMCLNFGKNAAVTAVIDKIKLKFKGGTLDSGFEIITSMYNASTIAFMHSKALKLAFWNADWVNIMRYFALILQIVVLPVAFTTCSLSIYALIRSLLNRRRKKRKIRRQQKYKLKRNYLINEQAVKKTGTL